MTASRLSGKVAIVSGASRGLGRAMAQALIEAGAKVALVARPSTDLNEAATALGSEFALAVPTDIRAPGAARDVIAKTYGQFGRLDILVNNAATFSLRKLHELSEDEVRREVETNFVAPINLMREAIPVLRKGDGGDIVNVSSESVRNPFPYLALYGATKAALEALSVALREEVRSENIRVTILRSGHFEEGTIGRDGDAEHAAAFTEAATKSGHLAFSGLGYKALSGGRALIDLLSMPRDATVDLLELRSTR